jgi:hypothetical protein
MARLSDRRVATVVLLLGILAIVLSLAWDSLGISETEGFGAVQIVGLIIGVVLILSALYYGFMRSPAAM